MDDHHWDLKSNYLLAFTACKYGFNPDCWTAVANDLADHIKTTAENCRKQFDQLCEQYGQHWEAQSGQPFHVYIYSMIRRLYYGDLCERMTESRDLLMVMYDFIRLFKGGRITQNDVQEILQDVRASVTTSNTEGQLSEREEKSKMLERLKQHMAQRMPPTSASQEPFPHSTYPIEFLPPPPTFFQEVLTAERFNSSTPSMNVHQAPEPTAQFSSVIVEKETTSSKPISTADESYIDEIEILSDDNEGDDPDRTTTTEITSAAEEETKESSLNKPLVTTTINSEFVEDQEESNEIFEEPMETNESSTIQPVPDEVSNSDDRDLYENVSSTMSLNDQSINGHISSTINDTPTFSNAPINSIISNSNDQTTLDSIAPRSVANQSSADASSTVVTPSLVPIEDDEAARMDAEQVPEPVPADVADVAIANDNAVFAAEELVENNKDVHPMSSISEEDKVDLPVREKSRETNTLIDVREHRESPAKRRRISSPKPSPDSLSLNFRKAVNSILTNLKNAKYGPDFSKPLRSFKLHDEYYRRVKKPLDIPEIRQRMNNGDYDANLLLFERDVLLMLTNALCMYHRDDDIHGHAQEMFDYAMELFTPLEEAITPWKTIVNGHGTGNGRHTSNADRLSSGNDSEDDDQSLRRSSGTRTPSIASTTSSIRTDGLTRKNRTSTTTPTHTMAKRQRKTTVN